MHKASPKKNVEVLSVRRVIWNSESAGKFLARPRPGIPVAQCDGVKIRSGPSNVVLGIEFGFGFEGTIQL